MPDYHFTGAYPRVLTGLSQGVNALLLPAEGDAPPYGATLEARTGDAIHTDEPYEHPELAEVAPEPQPVEADGTPILPPADPAPVVESAPETPGDPAHDAMTAEGAPAPAAPTA